VDSRTTRDIRDSINRKDIVHATEECVEQIATGFGRLNQYDHVGSHVGLGNMQYVPSAWDGLIAARGRLYLTRQMVQTRRCARAYAAFAQRGPRWRTWRSVRIRYPDWPMSIRNNSGRRGRYLWRILLGEELFRRNLRAANAAHVFGCPKE